MFELRALTAFHALTAVGLAILHRTLFDRLLIAQAVSEAATLVSIEGCFDEFGVAGFSRL